MTLLQSSMLDQNFLISLVCRLLFRHHKCRAAPSGGFSGRHGCAAVAGMQAVSSWWISIPSWPGRKEL